MNRQMRIFLSAAVGLGLAAFTIVSGMTAGIAADTTVLAFSCLPVYGLLEMAVLSYAPARAVRVRGSTAPARSPVIATPVASHAPEFSFVRPAARYRCSRPRLASAAR